MKVLWRQFIIIIFYSGFLFFAFICGTYFGVKNHTPELTENDWHSLEVAFEVKCLK
jgi:hypothetical protein